MLKRKLKIPSQEHARTDRRTEGSKEQRKELLKWRQKTTDKNKFINNMNLTDSLGRITLLHYNKSMVKFPYKNSWNFWKS